MSNKLLIGIIIALVGINVYMLVHLQKGNSRNDAPVYSESDMLHTYKLNFIMGIKNSGLRLEDISMKDSSGMGVFMKDFLKGRDKPMLVCRFSEQHCESCVSFAIKQLQGIVDSVGRENVLLGGTYRNNKIFNRVKPLYGIDKLLVYNVPELGIPVEELGYPYYFVLHGDLSISDVFVPDKGVPTLSNSYLGMIGKRYFDRNRHE
ncbi:MAG: hypothetical protein H6Q14_917 [Bacteroidetes bacterium]|nr:hypothetical protein [Bacteroidota bacterium]